ncbi:hypothetical protein CKO35_04725 [Ectothiorhodospira shaposhnikovii]|uniref:hypothetical protein n=1 Tax=Ectothiorhodospira shaposhnikovii TaxID=1054 RepID=UPI001903356B|nr:hypothetical protein [Ectothiorhodospira shaposhnikovii]MBK1672612.1 hypothetical protein [Ectothiorhodospira shaposhnikovii]
MTVLRSQNLADGIAADADVLGPMFFSQSSSRLADLRESTADRGLVFVKTDVATGDLLQFWDLPSLSTAYDNESPQVNISVQMMGPLDAGNGGTAQIVRVTDALGAVALQNEFFVDPALGAATDWVVTLPTKRYHVSGPFNSATGAVAAAVAPFGINPIGENFNYATAQSCEAIGVEVWDREELEFVPPTDPDLGFSPGIPGVTEGLNLCWEANVFSIRQGQGGAVTQSDVLGAQQTVGVIPVGDHTAGWIDMALDVVPGGNRAGDGLPAIGFAAYQFVNEGQTATGSLNQYGGGFRHRVEPN